MKYIDDMFEGYLDSEKQYWDYGTDNISGNNIIDNKRTGISFYDEFFDPRDAKYLETEKNLKGKVTLMSPEEYYTLCAKYCWPGRNITVAKLKAQRAADTRTLEKLKNVLLKYKRKFCMPMINYVDPGQEGLHRMYVIGELYGWDFKVPVLEVRYANEDRARKAAQEKRKSEIDWKVEKVVAACQRYEFRDKEELEDQIKYELDRQFEFMDDVKIPDEIHLEETPEAFLLSVSDYEYPIDKEEIRWKEADDSLDDDIEDLIDISDLEDTEDFLRRYFGDDWRKTHPYLKDTFGIKESITSTQFDIIKKCAKEARHYIVSKYGTGTDLCGKCIEASDYLVDLLNINNIKAKAVEGYIVYDDDSYCSDRAWDEHTWVELDDGTIVDVTVEQFNYMMYEEYPPILIEKDPHGYVYEKPNFLWLDELDESTESYRLDDLKETFNIKEDLTTKTVRRDNPNDFSPFGYKVDFYDGDNHIGEGSVCGIKDDNAFLYDFEVYPEFRGKGYSKEMLQYLIDQYDLKQLFVKPDNNVAINLYKKYGFDFDDDYFGDSDSGNMRLMIRECVLTESHNKLTLQELQRIVKKVYDAFRRGQLKGSNQNCMLCTWAVEANIRGIDMEPRAVYSPRDTIFTELNGPDILKSHSKIFVKDKSEVENIAMNAGDGGRFYCHVNWANSSGGHEFLLINIHNTIYIVDGQENLIEELNKNKLYFDDIDYRTSFLCRLDTEELNDEALKYNDEKYLVAWDDIIDVKVLDDNLLADPEINLYFLSEDNLDDKVLTPRVPTNYLVKNGYEDAKTPRVCFAPSISKCLMGLSQNLTGKKFYVHTPLNISRSDIYSPSINQVPDVKITQEKWIKKPVKLRNIGKIRVTGDSGLDGHSFTYGDKTAELYDWDWEWVSSDLKEDLHVDSINSPEELMDWMNDNITYELVDDEYSNSNGVPTKTAEEVLETKTGHCAEQSYLEKEILDGLGYESFLVMVKENNSKKEYGAEGSAHVFLVYKDEKDNYCWFEHSMQHSRGIHKYTSLEALLQDVANQWWRYDKNSDILEVRMMDKYITGVDNWGLAKECYKYPVKYTFDISNNIMESDVPLEESLNDISSIKEMDEAIQNEFAATDPGEGCIFIAANGKFINIYPKLDTHEDLCYWLEDNGFGDNPEEDKWFVSEFGYVRCRNSMHLCFIEVPEKMTREQYYSLEQWLEEKVSSDKIGIEAWSGEWKTYNLDDYFPEDIIKIIKRSYASGKLYEKLK